MLAGICLIIRFSINTKKILQFHHSTQWNIQLQEREEKHCFTCNFKYTSDLSSFQQTSSSSSQTDLTTQPQRAKAYNYIGNTLLLGHKQ